MRIAHQGPMPLASSMRPDIHVQSYLPPIAPHAGKRGGLHIQATTTPKVQAASSSISDSELARQYGVSTATIRRWRYRDDVHDRTHTRHNLLATLTPEQEEVLIVAREVLRLGLDDLLVVARELLDPRLPRSGLHRMLQRREVPNWRNWLGRTLAMRGSPGTSPSRTTSRASCISTSSTCLRCPTRSKNATCTSPSTAPRVGSIWRSGAASPRRMRGRL